VILSRTGTLRTETFERVRRSFKIDEIVSTDASPIPIQLGKFRVLILPELNEEVVSALPKEHVDLVCCGRLRTRRTPRDSLVAKITPDVVISSGTKTEIATNSKRDPASPRYLYLKQDGAITAEQNGDDLFLHTFCGTELRLTARSR
jgi:hypothetical protein